MRFGVVGFSTRGLVQAAVELGHRAVAIDAFGDQDTLDAADEVFVVDDWPAGILDAVERLNVDAWLIGGGMENCYEILITSTSKRLGDLAPVLGPSLKEMQWLRSLDGLKALCSDGIRWPTCCHQAPKDESDRWLVKSIRSAGGLGVRVVSSNVDRPLYIAGHESTSNDIYWQRRIDGRVMGVTWVLYESHCLLLGITQSFDQRDWPGPSETIYRGSIGPIDLAKPQVDALQELGQRVRRELPGYRGYLQADLIDDAAGQLWLLEFNPRWTAGMEVLHEAAAIPEQSPLAAHLKAWGIPPNDRVTWDHPPTRLVAKAVHYAGKDIELACDARSKLQKLRSWQSSADASAQWCIADVPPYVPAAPMRFLAGSPILTVKCRLLQSANSLAAGRYLTEIE